jgi:uncharacterized protein YjbJ (UPF0337 family)
MDWDQIERNWKRARGTVKRKWVKLTEDDLKSIDGQRERLEDIIHRRYGFAAEHVRKEVDDWLRVFQSESGVQSKRLTPLIQPARPPKR